MFKVECVGCQAPYQVDERRVPAKGLQMRCPKCGTSFKVEPSASLAGAAPAPPPPPSPLESASAAHTLLGGTLSEAPRVPGKFAPNPNRDALARTMIGMNMPGTGGADAEAAKAKKSSPFRMPRPGDPAPPPSQAPALSQESELMMKETKRDIPAVLDADLPDVLAAFDTSASLGQSTPTSSRPPLELATQPRRGLAEVTRPSERAAAGSSERFGEAIADLPEPIKTPALRARPANDGGPKPAPSPSDEMDLPIALGTARDAKPAAARPSAFDLAELPQPVAAPGVPKQPPRRARPPEPPGAAADPTADRGGSAHVPRRPPPRRRPEPARPAASANVVDLPARIEEHDVDLPVVGGAAPRPGAAAQAALRKPPSVAPRAQLDELDLPEIVSGLRAPAQNDLPSMAFESIAPELPSLIDDELPAVLGAELPTPSSVGLPELPAHHQAFGEVDLPTLTDAHLPSPMAGGFGEVDLPLVGGALPALPGGGRGDLPALGQALPALKHGDLPALGQALPALKHGDLPAVGQVLPALKQGNLPAVGQVLPALKHGDLPAVGQVLPALRQGDLPAVGQILPATKQQALGENMLEPISFPPDEPFGSGADPFADAPGSFQLGYGEVDIGGGAPASIGSDDMEFSAIPQDDGVPSPPRGAPAAASAAVHQVVGPDEAASTLEMAPSRPRPRVSRKRLLVAGAVSLLVIGGGALALEPSLGPFGVNFITDQLNRGRYEQSLATVTGEAQKQLAVDTLPAARVALARVDAASAEALRFEPLEAYAAYLRCWTVLRFGPLPELEAAAKALLDGVPEQSDDEQHKLAVAARSALARQNAKEDIAALGGSLEAQRLLAELSLATGDVKAARVAFQALSASGQGGAAATFGLARVELADKELTKAGELARKVLEQSPRHVGAKLVLLEVSAASDGSGGEDAGAETRRWVDEVTKALPDAAPGEAALAQTLLGELHLRYRRQGPAQKAFEESLQIVRKSPRALIGLGEVLQSAGRNAEALARFQVAAEADPQSLAAQLGIARAQLELGRTEEARALLTKLNEQYPKQPEIVHWTGRVQQNLGSNQAALDAYRTAIELAPARPDSLKSYLALSKLESQLGEIALATKALDEAQAKLPPSAPLFKAFGEIAQSQGRFGEALERFQVALRL
ncbi:MAG: tetratricopeptide repeat protein, partial [Polyangiaceae bacterium]